MMIFSKGRIDDNHISSSKTLLFIVTDDHSPKLFMLSAFSLCNYLLNRFF